MNKIKLKKHIYKYLGMLKFFFKRRGMRRKSKANPFINVKVMTKM